MVPHFALQGSRSGAANTFPLIFEPVRSWSRLLAFPSRIPRCYAHVQAQKKIGSWYLFLHAVTANF